VPNDRETIQAIARKEAFTVKGFSILTGGSINKVFLLDSTEGKKVLKLNETHRFPGMFAAEAEGLKELKNSKTVDVPEVLATGETGNMAYLLLEFKKEGSQKAPFWSRFAHDLAALHRTTGAEFGFQSSNYIGSLPQCNHRHSSAADFYLHERLEPQFKLAQANGFSFPGLEVIFQNIVEAIPKENPALVHGDLWSGNYIINEEGLPCFIDPAVSYAPREMDLAMMKLFGGFPEQVFKEYHEIFPLEPGFAKRVELWQLYYLLVHLNIFGSSYLKPVQRITRSFS
jgi:fructosamine-3-kinase